MKKKLLALVLTLSSVATIVLSGCSSSGNPPTSQNPSGQSASPSESSAGVAERHFTVTGGYSETHGYNADAQAYLDLLVESSGGAYTYDLYNGGSLVAFLNEYNALMEGTNDISISFDPLVDTHTPLCEVFMLPIISGDIMQLTRAGQTCFRSDRIIENGRTFYDFSFTDNGLKAFPYSACAPYTICFSAKLNGQIRSADDITSTMRFRSVTRTHNIFAEKMGFTPVTLTMNEIYDAFSKNSVDGMMGAPSWSQMGIEDYIGDVLDDICLGMYQSVFSMTIDTWNSLDDSVKQQFEEKAEETMYKVVEDGKGWTENFERDWALIQTKNGTPIHLSDMDQSFQDLYNKACGETWLEWIDKLEAAGHNGLEMAKLWRDCLVEQGCVVPDVVAAL